MRRILPRPSVASPLPIWPLLQECRAQRQWYSAASASRKADERDPTDEEIVSGTEADFHARPARHAEYPRISYSVDDSPLPAGTISSFTPTARESSNHEEKFMVQINNIVPTDRQSFADFLRQHHIPHYEWSSFQKDQLYHGEVILVYGRRADAGRIVKILNGQLYDGVPLRLSIRPRAVAMRKLEKNNTRGEIASRVTRVARAQAATRYLSKKTQAPISDVFKGKPSQSIISTRQDDQPARDATPTTQKASHQSLVTPAESGGLLESLRSLNKITDQLLRAMTEQNKAQEHAEKAAGSVATKIVTKPLQTSRAPTWEDRLRQRSIPTPLEQIGNPSPDGQLAKAMESFVNMNQDSENRTKLEKNKLRRWNRYSEVAPVNVVAKKYEIAAKGSKEAPSTDIDSKDDTFSKIEVPETGMNQEQTAGPLSDGANTKLFAQLFPESSGPEPPPPVPSSLANPENPVAPMVETVEDQPAQIGRQEDGTALPPDTVGSLSISESIDKASATVLIIRGLSANLAEDDIRRLVPKGRHLKGWHMGDSILRVVAQRDTRTLIRTGAYYIIFRHPSAAHEYRRALRRMQALSAQYTPSSIISPVMPTKQANVFQGTLDVAAAVRNFTLCVPGQPLDIAELPKPWSANDRALFKRGGYPEVKGSADESSEGIAKTAQVLVSFENGFVPGRNDIEAAIRWDGDRRHMNWRIDWRDEFSARVKSDQRAAVLEINDGPIRRLDPRETPVQVDRDNDTMLLEGSETTFEDEASDDTSTQEPEQLLGEPLPDDIKHADKVMRSRWIIFFQDEIEARRFAIAWHMRPLPMRQERIDACGMREDEVPICRAEVLW